MKSKETFTINDNSVSSENQLPKDKFITYIGNADAKKRILIIGNSITRHDAKPEIGWHGDFGMAASREENDYVHLLCGRILEKEDACIMVHQLALWERSCTQKDALSFVKASRNFAPDLLICRLGENIPSPTEADGQQKMEDAFSSLIDYIRPKKTVFTTCFWKHGIIDEAIRAVAKKKNAPLAELGDLGEDERFMAIGLFEHNGVAHHPGDLGMKEIAERIYFAMQNL